MSSLSYKASRTPPFAASAANKPRDIISHLKQNILFGNVLE
jgi:hypothetical protein